MKTYWRMFVLVGVALLLVSASMAITIDTVPVGNPNNVGELSGEGAGGYGPDRICGSVAYAYNIGKYEVTAGQYTEFLNAAAKTDTYELYNTAMSGIARTGNAGSYAYSVDSAFINRPVNYVSWGDSARFANWLHNGQPGIIGPGQYAPVPQDANSTEDGAYYLNGATTDAQLMAVNREADWRWAITSEDEWYKAAYYDPNKPGGPGYWDYPTSSNTAPGQDMADASGNNANWYTDPYTYPIDNGKFTTVAGEFQNSDSPYGTFDQGGNVWEWNEAIISGSIRCLRGGSFIFNHGDLLASYRSYYYFDSPTGEYVSVGFRVSVVPEPATLSLLALGGVTLLRRHRRG